MEPIQSAIAWLAPEVEAWVGTKFNELKTKDMKKIRIEQVWSWTAVVVVLVLMALGVVYQHKQHLVQLHESMVRVENLMDSTYQEKAQAENEFYMQALELQRELKSMGGEEYISDITRNMKDNEFIPGVEYTKRVIDDMLDGVDPDGDLVDDGDYRMALDNLERIEEICDVQESKRQMIARAIIKATNWE